MGIEPKPNFSTDPPQQEPSSGKAPRSWVPRACDRCRKRKARCDQQVPCRNCAEAGVTCTHDAPVLKRGPRPKPRNKDVESRLRNLESLLASISAGGSSAALSLSRRELDQIRVAAHLTPGSDTSPSSDHDGTHGGASGSANAAAASTASASTKQKQQQQQQQWTGTGPGSESQPGLTGPPSSSTGPASSTTPNQGPGQQPLDNYVPSIVFDPFGVPVSSQALQDPMISGSVNPTMPTPYDPNAVNNFVAAKTSPVATKGQDLLYRDSEGQTKWLGPSSGMPLLDRLKVNGTWNAPLEGNGNGLSDEWMSLSNAIGVDIDNSRAMEGFNPTMDPSAAMSPSSAHDDYLWERVTSVIPPDLIDSLVRSYFTISHLLWPILHAPTFMQNYVSAEHRKNPSFVSLILSVCSLSSRYCPDQRLRQQTSTGSILALDVVALAKEVIGQASTERADLWLVQALFNLSVVQEGHARTNQLWNFLNQAVSIAMDMGLHRKKDEYGFTAVELEEHKRTLWALYCQTVQASCSYGRPSMLRLADIELDEPAAVDDVYISVDQGIGTQPTDRPSVMAGFVAGVRLHMILERTIRRVNHIFRHPEEVNPAKPSFIDLVSAIAPRKFRVEDELELLPHVTDGLVGDWSFSPSTVSDSDSVRFFQRTRVFTLQQFIRLLSARHRFTQILGAESGSIGTVDEQAVLQQVTQSALGIIGTYSIIDTQGRLDFFGAHALLQAGAGLIGVVLHVRSAATPGSENVLQVALQGLCASILVLCKLGTRRPAGNRSAELLIEFSRACRIAIPGLPGDAPTGAPGTVEVPMLRALPRRSNSIAGPKPDLTQAQFDEWLGIALQGVGGAGDVWMPTPEQPFTPDQGSTFM